MSNHQHTVLVLLAFIVLLRLLHTGRISNAWAQLFGAGTAPPPPAPPASGTPAPGTQGIPGGPGRR